MQTKKELRRRLKQERLEMTDAEHTIKSRAIVEDLKQAYDWSRVRNLHFFEPISELLEPDIGPFITFIEDNYPDINLFTTRKIERQWDIMIIRGNHIPEFFDAVLVPMLGFDSSLNRLGYGGGYYDKFLGAQPQIYKIGVCFEIGHIDEIPVEEHDVQMDVIITEANKG